MSDVLTTARPAVVEPHRVAPPSVASQAGMLRQVLLSAPDHDHGAVELADELVGRGVGVAHLADAVGAPSSRAAAAAPGALAIVIGRRISPAVAERDDDRSASALLRRLLGTSGEIGDRLGRWAPHDRIAKQGARIDGLDVQVHGRTAVVGIGSGTTPDGAVLAARTVFRDDVADRVLVVAPRGDASSGTLADTVLTVGEGLTLLRADVRADLVRAWLLVPKGGRPVLERTTTLGQMLDGSGSVLPAEQVLAVEPVRVDEFRDVLCLEPGCVVVAGRASAVELPNAAVGRRGHPRSEARARLDPLSRSRAVPRRGTTLKRGGEAVRRPARSRGLLVRS